MPYSGRDDTAELSHSVTDPSHDHAVGSPEHLRVTFSRAAAATDRAVGVWPARSSSAFRWDDRSEAVDRGEHDLRVLRALVRASATAYVRHLRVTGVTPERMVVLVKTAAGHPGAPGVGAQELTNDVIRWSIDAYFDD